MHCGDEHSVGHYLDLSSAVLSVTLFPVGYVIEALLGRGTSDERRGTVGAAGMLGTEF
jgi:hypothetical protein